MMNKHNRILIMAITGCQSCPMFFALDYFGEQGRCQFKSVRGRKIDYALDGIDKKCQLPKDKGEL